MDTDSNLSPISFIGYWGSDTGCYVCSFSKGLRGAEVQFGH